MLQLSKPFELLKVFIKRLLSILPQPLSKVLDRALKLMQNLTHLIYGSAYKSYRFIFSQLFSKSAVRFSSASVISKSSIKSTQTEWLLKPKSSKYSIWFKRMALGVLLIYSLIISYAWYQNQQIVKNISAYLGQQLKSVQNLFSTENQKNQSALAIEKKSQGYLLTEIKKLREENTELQKRLIFFEEGSIYSSQPSISNLGSSEDLNTFKITKSQATLINPNKKLASAYYIQNQSFQNIPYHILEIKAWLIQPSLKAFEAIPSQLLDIELEIRYEINGQLVVENYPQKSTQANLFKNFELKAYRLWQADIEIPAAAKIQSAKMMFKNNQQKLWVNLNIDTNLTP
jgi:hypothetical protein